MYVYPPSTCYVQYYLLNAFSLPPSYVSRQHPVDPKTHHILGVQQVKPAELADQMMLDVPNAWGILHAIIDACLEQPEGKYLILKDPNQV